MSTYEVLLFLHIASSIVWLGAAFTLTLLAIGAERASDPGAKATITAHSDYLAPRLFIPASLATLVFGLLVAIEGSWDFGQLWIVIGIVGYLVSFLTGILYFKPEGERIDALVSERGPDHPEVERRIDTLEAVGRVELGVLFVVVADMVVKPTGDDVAFLVIAAAFVLAVAALSARGLRRAVAPSDEPVAP